MNSVRDVDEECPRMKVLSDFLAANPHNSNQKWAEYVALAPDLAGVFYSKCGPAAVSSDSSTTRSTASLRVLSSSVPTDKFSFKRDNTGVDLSPGAQRLYDLILGGSASPASSASPRATSSAIPTSGIPESAAATAYLAADRRFSSTAAPISTMGDSTSTAGSADAYKLFDRMPSCPEWSPDCALSIMVCRALCPVNEDILRPILAPYGVKRLIVKPRATTSNGSHYVKALVQLRSRDEAARARAALQGKCLVEGCC